jgi:mannose-1-phosphate guanylyltransferase
VPDSNYILEPEPRNTAPALGLAAVTLRRRDPQAVMACLTADHYIRNEARFRALLGAAGEVAEMDFLATLGIAPTYPATGFGYIERGEHIGDWSDFKVYRAVRFTEKPRQPEAQVMVADGRHAWNSGMFVWKAERLLAEFARQMPDFHTHLRAMEADPAEIAQRWSHAPATSIDFGIMEGARDVAVIPAEGLGWSDIGSWESLYEVLEPDASGNVVLGAEHLSLASRGVLIHSSHAARRLVATVGVSNLVVVDTGDVLLVCPREKSQDVRALVEALKKQPNGDQYL